MLASETNIANQETDEKDTSERKTPFEERQTSKISHLHEDACQKITKKITRIQSQKFKPNMQDVIKMKGDHEKLRHQITKANSFNKKLTLQRGENMIQPSPFPSSALFNNGFSNFEDEFGMQN